MPNITVAILALKETMIYTLAGPYDIFSSAALCSKEALSNMPQFSTSTRIVGLEKGQLTCYNGLQITCQQSLEELDDIDLIIVPSLDLPKDSLLSHHPVLKEWLQKHHKRGATIASICAGSFLLAEAGLLDGKITTTHWAFAEKMQELFPAVEVHADKIITEQDNIVCSGGATSWQDLVSYLVHRYASERVSHQMDHFFLLNTHTEGQLPYKKLASAMSHQDAIVHKTQEWLAENLIEDNLLSKAIALSGLPDRTFNRRFKKATQQSPNEFIQNVRIDQAKFLLETRSETIQAIAEEVGVNDGSYFRRLFKRKTGITAQNYRKQFADFKFSRKILKR